MKRIVSHQIPKAEIARPLLVGGLLLSMAAGAAEAQNQPRAQQSWSWSQALQTIISGDQGCVVGAQRQQPQPQRNCRPVGCVVRCD